MPDYIPPIHVTPDEFSWSGIVSPLYLEPYEGYQGIDTVVVYVDAIIGPSEDGPIVVKGLLGRPGDDIRLTMIVGGDINRGKHYGHDNFPIARLFEPEFQSLFAQHYQIGFTSSTLAAPLNGPITSVDSCIEYVLDHSPADEPETARRMCTRVFEAFEFNTSTNKTLREGFENRTTIPHGLTVFVEEIVIVFPEEFSGPLPQL